MRRRARAILVGSFFALALALAPVAAQVRLRFVAVGATGGGALSDILSTARYTDWSTAGAGTLPTRARCTTGTGTSVLAASSTSAQVNTAISGCDANHMVEIGAGSGTWTTAVILKSNITLRGAGPNSTFITATGNGGGAFGGNIEAHGAIESVAEGGTTVTWSLGYTKGTTTITLASVSGLVVGTHLALHQTDDSNTDTGQIWICSTALVCSDEGPSGGGASDTRNQVQLVRVTNIAGSVVTITPALVMPNWSGTRSPQAWHATSELTGIGIEDLSLDSSTSTSVYGFSCQNAHDSWIKHVRSIKTQRAHVVLLNCQNWTIRDSYFFDTQNHAAQSYGIECYVGGSELFENNIFQRVAAPDSLNGACSGSVSAYTYAINMDNGGNSQLYAASWLHASMDNLLFESNDGAAWFSDDTHGSHHFATVLRSHYVGWETAKTDLTIPIAIAPYGRYYNFIGNVLGHTGTHTTYTRKYNTNCTAYTDAIYMLGCSFTGGIAGNDTLVATTLLRWGNWDVVSGATRFVASEVPTGDAFFPNTLPATQVIPSSAYLSAKPAFYGATAWPSIGPDITGGSVSDAGGHVNRIPARVCFETTMGGAFGDTTAKAFSCTYP